MQSFLPKSKFDWKLSIVTNAISEKANMVPEALIKEKYIVTPFPDIRSNKYEK